MLVVYPIVYRVSAPSQVVQDFSHQQLTVCHEVLVARNFVPAVASAIKTLDKARDSNGLSLGGGGICFVSRVVVGGEAYAKRQTVVT